MHARPSTAATNETISCTFLSRRSSAITAKTSVKTKRPTLYLTTLSRKSVVAMIRGVNCPPAIWIATNSEPNVKTRNDSVSVITVWYSDWAPDMPKPVIRHASRLSRTRSTGATASTNKMERNGTIQRADLR